MKTVFFKKVLPLVVVLFAIGAAFTTSAMGHKEAKAGNFVGYIKLNPAGTECQASTMCSDVEAELCTVNNSSSGAQLWQFTGGRCITKAYRVHP